MLQKTMLLSLLATGYGTDPTCLDVRQVFQSNNCCSGTDSNPVAQCQSVDFQGTGNLSAHADYVANQRVFNIRDRFKKSATLQQVWDETTGVFNNADFMGCSGWCWSVAAAETNKLGNLTQLGLSTPQTTDVSAVAVKRYSNPAWNIEGHWFPPLTCDDETILKRYGDLVEMSDAGGADSGREAPSTQLAANGVPLSGIVTTCPAASAMTVNYFFQADAHGAPAFWKTKIFKHSANAILQFDVNDPGTIEAVVPYTKVNASIALDAPNGHERVRMLHAAEYYGGRVFVEGDTLRTCGYMLPWRLRGGGGTPETMWTSYFNVRKADFLDWDAEFLCVAYDLDATHGLADAQQPSSVAPVDLTNVAHFQVNASDPASFRSESGDLLGGGNAMGFDYDAATRSFYFAFGNLRDSIQGTDNPELQIVRFHVDTGVVTTTTPVPTGTDGADGLVGGRPMDLLVDADFVHMLFLQKPGKAKLNTLFRFNKNFVQGEGMVAAAAFQEDVLPDGHSEIVHNLDGGKMVARNGHLFLHGQNHMMAIPREYVGAAAAELYQWGSIPANIAAYITGMGVTAPSTGAWISKADLDVIVAGWSTFLDPTANPTTNGWIVKYAPYQWGSPPSNIAAYITGMGVTAPATGAWISQADVDVIAAGWTTFLDPTANPTTNGWIVKYAPYQWGSIPAGIAGSITGMGVTAPATGAWISQADVDVIVAGWSTFLDPTANPTTNGWIVSYGVVKGTKAARIAYQDDVAPLGGAEDGVWGYWVSADDTHVYFGHQLMGWTQDPDRMAEQKANGIFDATQWARAHYNEFYVSKVDPTTSPPTVVDRFVSRAGEQDTLCKTGAVHAGVTHLQCTLLSIRTEAGFAYGDNFGMRIALSNDAMPLASRVDVDGSRITAVDAFVQPTTATTAHSLTLQPDAVRMTSMDGQATHLDIDARRGAIVAVAANDNVLLGSNVGNNNRPPESSASGTMQDNIVIGHHSANHMYTTKRNILIGSGFSNTGDEIPAALLIKKEAEEEALRKVLVNAPYGGAAAAPHMPTVEGRLAIGFDGDALIGGNFDAKVVNLPHLASQEETRTRIDAQGKTAQHAGALYTKYGIVQSQTTERDTDTVDDLVKHIAALTEQSCNLHRRYVLGEDAADAAATCAGGVVRRQASVTMLYDTKWLETDAYLQYRLSNASAWIDVLTVTGVMMFAGGTTADQIIEVKPTTLFSDDWKRYGDIAITSSTNGVVRASGLFPEGEYRVKYRDMYGDAMSDGILTADLIAAGVLTDLALPGETAEAKATRLDAERDAVPVFEMTSDGADFRIYQVSGAPAGDDKVLIDVEFTFPGASAPPAPPPYGS